MIGDEEIQAVTDTLRSGWLTSGPRVRKLEERFAAYARSPHAIATSSCTEALHLSLVAAGVGDGSYRLGNVEVEVRDGVARRGDGVLAGSSLTLIDAVRRLHALGVPLAEAIGAATTVPAAVVRRPDLGSLKPGAAADVVVLDDALEIRTVVVGGQSLVVAA